MALIKDSLTDINTVLAFKNCECSGRYLEVSSRLESKPIIVTICAYCGVMKFPNFSTPSDTTQVDNGTVQHLLIAEYLLPTSEKNKAEIMSILLGRNE